MKKKLVAFAVTAAMVITSAVPVFATLMDWSKPADSIVDGNVITISKTETTTDGVTGSVADGVTFDTVIDLNKGIASDGAIFTVNFDDKDGNPVGTTEFYINESSSKYALGFGYDAEKVTVEGIVTLNWTITEDGIKVDVTENGYDELVKGTSEAIGLPEGAVSVDSLTVNPMSGTVYMYGVAPEEVVAVEVVKADADGNPVNEDGELLKDGEEPIVETQPVEGGSYTVYSVTLDDGTVIEKDELSKYVTFEWKAVRTDGTVVWTVVEAGKTQNWTFGNYTIPADVFGGCKVTLEVKAKKSAGLFGGAVWGADADPLAVADRYAGENRYETAYAVADALKEKLGVEKFNNIVVASGEGWCDALSGTTFAARKDAPIILINSNSEQEAIDYIYANMYYSGTVYILGGENSVSAGFEDAISKHNVVRLGGANRYETNLAILNAFEEDFSPSSVVAVSGDDFGDALSVAAANRPIMLVSDALAEEQKEFLEAENKNIFVVGGIKVVSMDVQDELAAYDGDGVERFWGSNRYETAYAVATSKLVTGTDVVLVSGQAYADGLTGGVYAVENGAAVLLVDDNNTYFAGRYAKANNSRLTVIGGEAVVSNAVVQDVYSQKIA